MPIASEATHAAAADAHLWAGLAAEWRASLHPGVWTDLPPREAAVVRFYDPSADLHRRAAEWGFDPGGGELADLALFAAGLAMAEAEAWSDDRSHLAARALETRRFLVADRILHWAVPWLDTVGRCFPDEREVAHRTRDQLLAVGERLRCAPLLAGREGTALPGEDSYGPVEVAYPRVERLLSIWSGAVLMRATLGSMRVEAPDARAIAGEWLADPGFRRDLATLYEVAAGRWRRLAGAWEGTARLWSDLAERATRSARALA